MKSEPASWLDGAIHELYTTCRPEMIEAVRSLMAREHDPKRCYQAALRMGAPEIIASDVRRIARYLDDRRSILAESSRMRESFRQ